VLGVLWALHLPFGRSTQVLACGVREDARRLRSRRPLYSGTGASRLRLGPGRFEAFAALLSALSSCGCALQLESTLSRADADVEQTGSIDMPIGRLRDQGCGAVQNRPRLCARSCRRSGRGAVPRMPAFPGRTPIPALAATSRRWLPPTM